MPLPACPLPDLTAPAKALCLRVFECARHVQRAVRAFERRDCLDVATKAAWKLPKPQWIDDVQQTMQASCPQVVAMVAAWCQFLFRLRKEADRRVRAAARDLHDPEWHDLEELLYVLGNIDLEIDEVARDICVNGRVTVYGMDLMERMYSEISIHLDPRFTC